MKLLVTILFVFAVTANSHPTVQPEKPQQQLNQCLAPLNQKSGQLLLLTQKLRP